MLFLDFILSVMWEGKYEKPFRKYFNAERSQGAAKFRILSCIFSLALSGSDERNLNTFIRTTPYVSPPSFR